MRVYEQIDPSLETQVGNIDIRITDDNLVEADTHYLQFSTGTAVYKRPGLDILQLVAGTATFVVFKDESRTDDGTLRRIERHWTSGGQISQTDEIKENGSLLIRTLVYLNQVPPTPSGFTVIAKKVDHVNGLPLYSYTFAKGNGEIARKYQGIQAGTASFNITAPITPIAGAIVETVTYLTASSVTAVPTTSNLSQGVRFAVSTEDQDGYRIWTVYYGMGAGIVEFDSEFKNGGKLVLYHRVGFGAPPSAPASTIGGSVVLTSSKTANADGYNVYDYHWAEGQGQISLSTEWRLSPDQGTTGVTVYTIKFLTASTVAVDPTTGPVGTEKISSSYEDTDGYRVWTSIYASGKGTIATTYELSYGNALAIYKSTSINAPPPDPSSTLGGIVALVKNDTRNGTRFEDGTIIYDYEWAEGNGEVDREYVSREGGLLEYRTTVFSYFVNPADWIPSPGGILVKNETIGRSGYNESHFSWMYNRNGLQFFAGTAVMAFGVKHPFTYPGRAKTYANTFIGVDANGSAAVMLTADVFKSPPITVEVDATVTISYQTSPNVGTLPFAFWNPTDWAVMKAFWQRWDLKPRSEVISLPGYLCMNAGTTYFTSGPVFPGGYPLSVFGEAIAPGSAGQIVLSGGPSPSLISGTTTFVIGTPELVPAFVDLNNDQQWYRRTIITATIPTQPDLIV